MDRLEHRRAGAGRVEVAGGGEPDAAGDRPAEVGEDVTEQVVRDDHVVALRVGHEVDAGGVDVVVGRADVGVLGSDMVERALPQVAGEGQHVRLVDHRQVLAAALLGQPEGVADAALDAHAGVDRALRGHLVLGPLAEDAALAHVRALGVLADHHHVDARRRVDERPLVHVEVEVESHLQ